MSYFITNLQNRHRIIFMLPLKPEFIHIPMFADNIILYIYNSSYDIFSRQIGYKPFPCNIWYIRSKCILQHRGKTNYGIYIYLRVKYYVFTLLSGLQKLFRIRNVKIFYYNISNKTSESFIFLFSFLI